MEKYLTKENAEKAYENDFDDFTILEIMGLDPSLENTKKYEAKIQELAGELDTHYLDCLLED